MSLPSNIFNEVHLKEYDKRIEEAQRKVEIVEEEIGDLKDEELLSNAMIRLKEKKDALAVAIQNREDVINEKKKLSTQSLLVSVSDFESRLMKLATLCRNSLMYLSYAIFFEERKKPDDKFVIPQPVPLKK